ncbi:MAG: GNAT family N-acetyltransferase [Bacteroidota bacterium]
MNITKEEQESKGRFVAKEEETELGEMTYSLANDGQLLIIDHTGVNEGHGQTGVGKALFEHMVETVRAEGRKVMPLCPFARAMFQKNQDKWDVLRHNSL